MYRGWAVVALCFAVLMPGDRAALDALKSLPLSPGADYPAASHRLSSHTLRPVTGRSPTRPPAESATGTEWH